MRDFDAILSLAAVRHDEEAVLARSIPPLSAQDLRARPSRNPSFKRGSTGRRSRRCRRGVGAVPGAGRRPITSASWNFRKPAGLGWAAQRPNMRCDFRAVTGLSCPKTSPRVRSPSASSPNPPRQKRLFARCKRRSILGWIDRGGLGALSAAFWP